MAQSYTRQSSFADGDTITAALFNNEYNQLVNAFSYSSTNEATTGHRHDGSAGEGGNIPQIGDLDFLNKIVVDSTNNRWGFYVQVASSAVEQLRLQDGALIPVTDSDVDLGTSSLYFKDAYIDTVTTTGNVSVGGNLTVTGNATISGNLTFGDADTDSINLAAEIDSHIVPNTDDTYDLGTSTKQWRNLYIDGTAEIDTLSIDGTTVTSTAAELNILDGVTSTAAELNILDGVTSTTAELNILDGVTATAAEINLLDGVTSTTAELNILDGVTSTAAELNILDGVTATAAEINLLDGVTSTTAELNILDGVTSTAAELNILDGKAFLDEDNMASNSATGIASQQSIKAYVDSQVTAQDLDITTDSGTIAIDLDSETLTVTGGTGLDSSATGNAVTLAIDSTVATLTGSQTLTNKTLTTPVISSISNTGTLTLPTSTDTLVGRATTDTLTNKTLTSATLTSPVINTGVSGTAILDEDDMSSNSATQLATQQSIKAYVDSTVAATNEVVEDSTPQLGGDLDTNGNDILFADNDKAIFGAGSDLQIYHDGSDSYIHENGDGLLKIGAADKVQIYDSTFSNLSALFDTNGTARLYYNGAAKIETTSTGIDVTGTAVTDGLTVSGDATFDTSTLKVDSSNNRVGVGTASPSVNLHVSTSSGDCTVLIEAAENASGSEPRLQLKGTNTSSNPIIEFGDSGAFPGSIEYENSDNSMRLTTNASERMRIDSSGNVGIGTTSPDSLLHLHNTSQNSYIHMSGGGSLGETYGGFVRGYGVSGEGGHLELGVFDNATKRVGIEITQQGNEVIFDTAGSERMRIDSSGNVAIGDTNPRSHRLYLENAGSSGAGQLMLVDSDNSGLQREIRTDAGVLSFDYWDGSNRSNHLTIAANGNVGIGTSSPSAPLHILKAATGINVATDMLKLSSVDTNPAYYVGFQAQRDNSAGQGLNILTTNVSGTVSESMRITPSGNVGIGTSSPSSKLDVAGNIGSSGTISSTSVLNCNGSGSADSQVNIGVGRNANGYAFLDLIGDTTYTDYGLRIIRNNSGANTTSVVQHRGTGTLGLLTQEAAAIQFSTNNSEAMRIDSSGNLLVGRTSDSGLGKLQVYGNVDLAGGNVLLCRDTGNVGIGTSSPSAALEVTGNTLVSDDGADDFIKQSVSGTTSTLSFGNTESTGGTAQWSYNRSTGALSGNIGAAAGTNFMTVLGTGNVGIGTSSPGEKLDVQKSGDNIIQTTGVVSGGVTALKLRQSRGSLASPTNSAANGDGNYIVSQIYRSSAYNTNAWIGLVTDSATDDGRIIFGTASSGTVAEKMRIDSNGDVGIGVSNPSARLHIYDGANATEATAQLKIEGSGYVGHHWLDGTAYYIGQNSAGRALRLYSSAETAGVALAAGATSFGTYSDERLKENIQDIGSVTDKIKDIRCVSFNRTDIENSKETIGFIAQDFVGKFDQVLDKTKLKDGDEEEYYSIKYTETIPVLLKAIQEQQAQIDALQSEINELKNS